MNESSYVQVLPVLCTKAYPATNRACLLFPELSSSIRDETSVARGGPASHSLTQGSRPMRPDETR